MESGRGYARFFFKDAVGRVSAVTSDFRKRYPNLYDRKQIYHRNSPASSYRSAVGKIIDGYFKQVYEICEYDPVKIKELEKCPISDYYLLLNNLVERVEKAKLDKAKKK